MFMTAAGRLLTSFAGRLQVLVAGPGQQWRDYFICKGTGAIPCLVRQMTSDAASRAASSAASRALAGLAAIPVNQSEALQVGTCKHIHC